ncbi:MAG TPA: hypothetical protein VFW19_15060 [Allosphingosinicella sp.]|nr:hypothetical protein [Allosphingosinicella sp.]
MRQRPSPAVFAAASCSLGLLAACGAHPRSIGEHVVYQPVEKEVPRPCPVAVPKRPAKLQRPLPSDPAALADLLIAKLLEWDGPGKYGDQAEAALKVCTAPEAAAPTR